MIQKGKIRNIAILGSTGSIGTQTLDVIEQFPELFKVSVLTANNNADLLIEQALKFQPNAVVIVNEKHYEKVSKSLESTFIKVYAGIDALEQIVEIEEIDIVLTALVGFSGLRPTLNAIKHKKNIALANKETLVVAGELVTKAAIENKISILPVDSEHSAIFQSLMGENLDSIEKIYLTASGGPFRGMSREQLTQVTLKQALKHPNWEMGAKITIDSASMMNKGLEVIEAKFLFGLKDEQIDIIVHPQSIIHSIVQFNDGSMKAQMGLPDMKLPIQFALAFPERPKNNFPRFNFMDYPTFTFEKVDHDTFENVKIAYKAMKLGGNMPCIINAANEVANLQFRQEKIRFLEIPEKISYAMDKIQHKTNCSLEDLIETDRETRSLLS